MDIFNDLLDLGVSKFAEPAPLPTLPTPQPVSLPSVVEQQPTVAYDPNALFDAAFSARTPEAEQRVKTFRADDLDRFTNSRHYAATGYDPFLPQENVAGKTYEPNEFRYSKSQTWGDVMGNAVGGMWGLTKQSFVNGWEQWGNTYNALTGWNSDKSFMQRLAGSPEELMRKDEEQKAVLNKYAIFKGPNNDSGFGVFNREFLGNMIQQTGFTVGTGAQFLSEMLVTWGIGEALGGVAKGAGWLAKAGAETEAMVSVGEKSAQIATRGEAINAARKATDPTNIKEFANNLWDYTKQGTQWAGEQLDVLGGINNLYKAKQAGATTYQLASMGVGSLTKSLAALNMATSEASFEAANTYGQMYGDLINEYQLTHNGEIPTGEALDRINKVTYAAATDNFGANTAILLASNAIQFGNLMSKFGSSSRLLREAAEKGDRSLFTVSGTLKETGEVARKAHTPGRVGMLSAFNPIRKDFGLGTALWQIAKRSPATKFELSEGIQEVLQSASDETFRTYYKNLYNGGTDINGNSFLKDLTSADWANGLQSQLSMEGWQTFLMGAATGLFIAPIHSSVMQGFQKGKSIVDPQYKNDLATAKTIQEENKSILNTFYADPAKALNEHIGNIKTQGVADKNQQSAIVDGSRYEFHNSKGDAFAKAVAVAIKTGNYESFRDHIIELGEKLDNEQFAEATGLKGTDVDAKAYTQAIVKDIEQYHDNWENLKDRFSHYVQPELYVHDQNTYRSARLAKKVLDDAIEILATTSYQATNALKRAVDIRAEAITNPSLGQSANKAFDILGNLKNAKKELTRLSEEIKNLEELGIKDADVAEAKKYYKEQQKHLQDWVEGYELLQSNWETPATDSEKSYIDNHLMTAHKGYIEAVNKEYDNDTIIDRRDLEDIYGMLLDYNILNRDSSQYIEALNVLTDPKNFKLLFEKFKSAIEDTTKQFHEEQQKEVDKRTEAVTGQNFTTSEETPGETSEDEGVSGSESIEEFKKVQEEINTRYQQLLQNATTPEEREAIANEWFDALEEAKQTPTEPIPEDVPSVEAAISENTPKLKIVRSQVSVGVHRLSGESTETAESRLGPILAGASKEDLEDSLSLTVTKNAQLTQPRYDVDGNQIVESQPQQYSFQLSYKGEPIGYLSNSDQYIFRIGDQQKNALQLTQSEFGKLFDWEGDFSSEYEAFNQFQSDYKTAQQIQKNILAAGKTKFSGTELFKILSIEPSVTFDFVDSTKVGDEGVTDPHLLRDLDINYEVPINDEGDRGMVVVNNGAYRRELEKNGSIPIQDTPMYIGRLEDIDASPPPVFDNVGMYSVAVDVAGKIHWIQVTPTIYNKEQVTTTLGRIKALSDKGLEQLTSDEKNEISDLVSGIFIALPVYVRDVEGKKQIDPAQKWDIRPIYNQKNNTIFLSTDKEGFTSLNLDTASFDSPEQFAQTIQKKIKKGFPEITITEENFRHQVPLSAPVEERMEAVRNMTASIYGVKRMSFRFGLPQEQSTSISEIAPAVEQNNQRSTSVQELKKALTREEQREQDLQAAEDIDFDAFEPANKVVPNNFTTGDVENIDKFTVWVNRNLPSLFTIEDLGILQDNLYNGYKTVGQFIGQLNTLGEIVGKIRTSPESAYKYHEAFHGVFRLLLPQNKIDELLRLSRKEGKATSKDIQDLRESDFSYSRLSDKELADRFYEERLADKFDTYMMDRKPLSSNPIMAFFQKLARLIKNLFSRISGNRLEAFFSSIDRGTYKEVGIQQNSFTNKIQEGITEPILKVIKFGEKEITTRDGRKVKVDNTLPQAMGDQLSSNIAALYHKLAQNTTHNKRQLLNKILDTYKATYDTKLPIYKDQARKITDIPKRAEWMKKLKLLEAVVTRPAARESLIEAVDLHLQIMGYRQELDNEENEALEEEVGSRNTDTAHKSTKNPMSDYGSLSKALREFIGSTTYQLDQDEFGNTSLIDGTPIYQVVNANKVYNGLLGTLSNIADEKTLINKLVEYTKNEGNPETTKFINYLIEETGLDPETLTVTKNAILMQQVIKGFNQYSVNSLFTQVNQNNRYQISNANTKDVGRVQVSNWQNQYDSLKTIKTSSINKLVDRLQEDNRKLSNQELNNLSKSLSENIQKETGIALHQNYIKFSIVASKGEGKRTQEQEKFYNAYSNTTPIVAKTLAANVLVPLQKGNNIFSKGVEVTEGEKISTSRPYQYMTGIAGQNAQFDESINTISYTNAEGETVYAHKLPNFDFVTVKELNNTNKLNSLKADPEYSNFLLDNPKFLLQASRNQLEVIEIDGMRKVAEGVTDTGETYLSLSESINKEDGVTYGQYNKREVLATLLGLYDVRQQPGALVRNEKNTDYWYQVPVMTRTIEAKNSAHMVKMAVIPCVKRKTYELSNEALDKMYGFVLTELENIKEAKNTIEQIDSLLYEGDVIEGYHTGAKRGLRFFNMRTPLGELAAEIEANPVATLDEEKIKKQLNTYWLSQAQVLADMMVKEGLVSKTKEGYKNILAPDFLFKGYGLTEEGKNMTIDMGMKDKDFIHNITQILVNDYINTVAINQLMLGNEAKAFKGPIDQVKRMTGANAQGPSMEISFTSSDMGIEHELHSIAHLTYSDAIGVTLSAISGSKIQSDDGQMYGTAKGLRYSLFGFGKLNMVQSKMLEKLEKGTPISADEFFAEGGLKDKGAFNSLKLVYYDGKTYLKCSMIPLFRESVSYKGADGNWVPRPGMEDAHLLLDKMEDYEERNKTVVFAHPESVSKGMKKKVIRSISTDISDNDFNTIQARFMRQQLENPSNKMSITDPTQVRQQIMSEQNPKTKVMFFGKETTIGDIRDAYMNDISQRVTNSANNAMNSIFTMEDAMLELDKSLVNKEFTPKMGVFFDTMKENLQATGADQQTLGFLETKDGKPVYNLNFPSTLDKFAQIFLNYFSKGVVSEKVPGQSLALVSGAHGLGLRVKRVISLDDNGQPKEWEVVTNREFDKNPGRYTNAKSWSDPRARIFEGLQVGDYIVDSLRHNVPVYEDGKIVSYFSEYIAPAHHREEMSGIPISLQPAFGVRIPADDKHSNIALRKVDTLPVQYGSIGIFPPELVEISGADFDIDKIYLSIADTYANNEGKRVAYGTATTKEDQFNEFVEWQKQNNKQFKQLYKSDEIFSKEEVLVTLLGEDQKFDNPVRIASVLKKLGLPSTVQEYNGRVELNNGVLNNRVLQERLALQTNSHVKEFNSVPTTTDPLLKLAEKLIREFQLIDVSDDIPAADKRGIKEILAILQEKESDVSSIIGKVVSNDNNSQGAKNIGATANAIQVYSLLNQFNVKLNNAFQLTIDGNTFKSFSPTREWSGKNSYLGTRIGANLSTLLNAMTDNAKERLAARLGLNITALGYVSNMVSTGVPLETSVLLMLQPIVRKYFSDISKLTGTLKTADEVKSSKRKVLDNYLKSVDNGKPIPLTTTGLQENLVKGRNNTLDKTLMNTIALLEQQAKTLANISKVQKLSQGLPTTWEDVDSMNTALAGLGLILAGDRYVVDPEFDFSKIAVNVSKILLKDHGIIATNLKVLGKVQYLGRKLFIEKTPLFNTIKDSVLENMKPMGFTEGTTFNKQLKNDIISFLSIKSYINWLNRNALGSTRESLTLGTVYPTVKAQMPTGFQDALDIVEGLRKKLTGANENYFLSRFLLTTPSSDQKDSLNTVEANTWARLSDAQQDKLVSSFIQLYSDAYMDVQDENGEYVGSTHDDAIALFNYLLVKDGGQFKSGSFIKYMPNFIFKDIMDRTSELNDLLSGIKPWNTKEFESITGSTQKVVIDQFIDSYKTHIGNKFFLYTPEELGLKLLRFTTDGVSTFGIGDRAPEDFPSSIRDTKDTVSILVGANTGEGTVTYRKSEWTGTPNSFKGQGVFGQVPVYTPKAAKGSKVTQQEPSEEELAYIQAQEYEQQQGPTKTPEQRLQELGIVRYMTAVGPMAQKDGKVYQLEPGDNTVNKIVERINTLSTQQPSVPLQQSELIGGMFTREELNDLYKKRTNKEVTAEKFKQIAEDYLSVPWEVTKEEITGKLINCI